MEKKRKANQPASIDVRRGLLQQTQSVLKVQQHERIVAVYSSDFPAPRWAVPILQQR
jgi:hypothetical protein